MTLTALQPNFDDPPKVPALSDDWRGVLNAMRVTALSCRVAAREDLFRACALLTQSKTQAQDAFAQALFCCLNEALGRRAIFFRPGEAELSFDEAWLTRLLMASHGGDGDSVMFLIKSRVSRQHQRHIAFLIKGISEQFALN